MRKCPRSPFGGLSGTVLGDSGDTAGKLETVVGISHCFHGFLPLSLIFHFLFFSSHWLSNNTIGHRGSDVTPGRAVEISP